MTFVGSAWITVYEVPVLDAIVENAIKGCQEHKGERRSTFSKY